MSAWLDRYEQFLLNNVHQITSIEGTLRSLGFILPGRYQNIEVVSESLYSTLQIIGMYHDRILVKANLNKEKLTAHNRYAQSMNDHQRLYKAVSLALALTRCTELLMEMAAMAKAGANAEVPGVATRKRARAVVGIEMFKAILRLILLVTYKKPTLTDPVIQRQVDAGDVPSTKSFDSKTTYTMSRTGLELPQTPANGLEYLSDQAILAEDVKDPRFLLHILSHKGNLAELLHIARPVLYSYLVYRGTTSKNKAFIGKWGSWVAGISVDYLSNRLLVDSYREDLPGGLRSLTALEAEEVSTRRMAMWWWFLRGPMYEKLTRPVLDRIMRALDIPVINLFSGILEDYLYLLDNYYFSSATQ